MKSPAPAHTQPTTAAPPPCEPTVPTVPCNSESIDRGACDGDDGHCGVSRWPKRTTSSQLQVRLDLGGAGGEDDNDNNHSPASSWKPPPARTITSMSRVRPPSLNVGTVDINTSDLDAPSRHRSASPSSPRSLAAPSSPPRRRGSAVSASGNEGHDIDDLPGNGDGGGDRPAATAGSVPLPPLARNVTTLTTGSSKPYSAFSGKTKWVIASLAGMAGIFSPISSNIFVPALPAIARAFNRSKEDISLAVTIYLIFQALTPSFFGSASDSYGRRPVLLLTMVIYMGANIGLALMPTSKYWLLLFLRALQSTGGSAAISIGAGSVADVAAPSERGKYMAVFQAGVTLGPALGPLLGGVFAQTIGWRAIFWFLTIAVACVMVPFLFLFPETLRSIVGDGSLPAPMLNASPLQIYQEVKQRKELRGEGLEPEHVDRPPKKKFQPLSAFMILFVPEILLTFIVVSFPYLSFYCLLTVFSTALEESYHLNELQIGLCYLPLGFGTLLTNIINGRLLDYYYGKEEQRVGGDYRHKPHEFRIELTRFRSIYLLVFLQCAATVSSGWCIQVHAPLAATLVCTFFVGLGSGTIGTGTIYGQDLLPGKGGAVSASLNLVRCAFGAIGTAFIMLMYHNLGAGSSFVLLSGMCIGALPITTIVIRYAPGWREWRARKASVKGTLAAWIWGDTIPPATHRKKEEVRPADSPNTVATVVGDPPAAEVLPAEGESLDEKSETSEKTGEAEKVVPK